MDVVGSEIGQKMRSAIKAKLTELGCYVDDELPDYVMVMVANKRTRAQMEDDLQLFLGDNTELFVNWLHQVLKKLQEVTVATPIKPLDRETSKEKDKVKDKKSKDKKIKEKSKKSDLKKAKKKEKEKLKIHRKKEEKKAHKKKKSKHDEMIRPNIPPLLMNIEKESEPSITDVFAGQILKNHGIILDAPKETPKETKPDIKIAEEIKELETVKRPMVPIIDPATILAEPTEQVESTNDANQVAENTNSASPKEEQLKEINEIEAKIQGLKQKLADQLDSMSDDEDFLNIRTEAEELMNDFAEDVFQEISQQTTSTPPITTQPKSPIKAKSPVRSRSPIKSPKSPMRPIAHRSKEPEVLPQIELKLPKRPVRERLGTREEPKKSDVREKVREDKKTESPERFTPERDPEVRPPTKSAKSRLGDPPQPQKETQRKISEESEKHEPVSKRLTSKVSVLENRNPRMSCASVVRVRPRPRVPAPASSLLLRAVADAHKSLLNIPPKKDLEPTVKRALVLPMRRCEPQKIVIQVPGNDGTQADDIDAQDAISLGDPESEDSVSKMGSDNEKEEYVPTSITKKFHNTDYTPSPPKISHRTSTKKDDTIIIETINIHNTTVGKDKNTKFIVTMDGYHPNAFLAKKLQTEGLLNDEDEPKAPVKPSETVPIPTAEEIQKEKPQIVTESVPEPTENKVDEVDSSLLPSSEKIKDIEKKRLSDTSEESDTQVIIENVKEEKFEEQEKTVKRKSTELLKGEESPPTKKKRSSPIVFDMEKTEKDKRKRTESASSDNHIIVTTTTNSHKYDSLPPLSTAERKPIWCRAFPQCRYGSACAFQHPRCRFAAACTRRNCPYSHSGPLATPVAPVPVLASHVVPAANYKSISATPLPAMCKYYPACSNPGCHFYHPKPCRYGKACANKFDCNFYHADVPSGKWRFPVL